MIQKAITNFNWKQAFSNSSVNENVRFFGETLKNIFSNYIPNRRIKIDYRKPKWMTPKILAVLKKRSKLLKKYYVNLSMISKEERNSYSKYCFEIITDTKDKFLIRLSVRLDDPNTSTKSYWSNINNFLNNKKILTILSLLFNGNLISDLKKANLFNSYFSSQCILIDTSGKLPLFAYKMENHLDSVEIIEEDIYLIIKNLIPNKAHGWDDISIRMIKLCGKCILFPLKFLFQTSLKKGLFPVDWKKAV